VLRALRGEDITPTVIVSIAYEGASGGDAQHRLAGASVDDLRRSLEVLTDEEGALLRAIRRPRSLEGLGRHPLGNLLIASAAAAFDDYSRASAWLGEQLGVAGAVLPATIEPVRREIKPAEEGEAGADAGDPGQGVSRLGFLGDNVKSPDAAVAAINDARWVLLAPGPLYRSVLSSAAVPDLARALKATRARVLWIANLEPDPAEAANLTAIDHLLALRAHGVRVDVVLHDPSATLRFDPSELTSYGVESVPRELRSSANPARHDPERLRSVLRGLIRSRPGSTVGSRSPG
jgi:uncharacterized cofD-like protein